MAESWITRLEPLNDLEVPPHLRAEVEARRRHKAVERHETRRRVLRLAVVGTAGLAVVMLTVLMVIAAHSRRDHTTPANHKPDRTKPSPTEQRARFGEPVELDGMTFVVKELDQVGSVRGSNGQLLKAPAGHRLWVLTVTVRNDGDIPAHEPFCHGRDKRGELVSSTNGGNGISWHGWSRDSLSIDPHHQLCNDIPPRSTETFRLLFYLPKWQGTVETVALSHRSSPERHMSFAFVTRVPVLPR